MEKIPNHNTKIFVKEVKSLVEQGRAGSYAAIADEIEWNKSGMSLVMNGKRNVPFDVFKKFTHHYQIKLPIDDPGVNEPEAVPNSKDDMIATLKENNKLLADQLSLATGELRHIAVMNFAMLKVMRKNVAQILARVEKSDLQQVVGKINKETSAYYRSVRERGSLIDLDI